MRRLDRYLRARAALREAVRMEPHDPLPRALLGDLAVRRGNLRAARRYDRRSSELDPKSPLIRSLARDPGQPSLRIGDARYFEEVTLDISAGH